MQIIALLIFSLAGGALLRRYLKLDISSGAFALCCSIICICSMFGIIGLIALVNRIQTQSTLVVADCTMYLVALAALIAWCKCADFSVVRASVSVRNFSSPALLVLLILATYFTYSLTQPTQAWDALDHWASVSRLYLQHLESGTAIPFVNQHRHPNTLPYLMAWFAGASHPGSLLTFSMAAWPLFGLATFLALYGYLRLINANRVHSTLFAYLIIAMPLIENHIVQPGYADMPMNTVVVMALLLLALSEHFRSRKLFALGMLFSLLPITLKNTGLYYSLLPLAGWLAMWVRYLSWPQVLGLWLGVFCLSLALIQHSWEIWIFGTVAFDASATTVTFADKTLVIDLETLPAAARAILVSYFANQSFSVWIGGGLLVVAYNIGIYFQSLFYSENMVIDRTQTRILGFAFTFAIVTMSASLLTDYGLRFGAQGSDTGHSRFSLPVASLGLILVAVEMCYHSAKSSQFPAARTR